MLIEALGGDGDDATERIAASRAFRVRTEFPGALRDQIESLVDTKQLLRVNDRRS